MGRPPTISRDQILQTARAVFTEKGFAAATLADIAGDLHVTPAAVLRHFESKEALFGASMRGSVALPECVLRLEGIDASTDPRAVLRQLAEEWIPFAKKTIAQNVVLTMHARSNPTLVLPFDPASEDSPPKRGEKIITGYFRRANAAGVLRIGDPRAAALLFMGSLVSYVFMHVVLRVVEPPYPIGDYIDALIDLWSHGAIVGGHRGKPAQKSAADRAARVGRGGNRGDRALSARTQRAP